MSFPDVAYARLKEDLIPRLKIRTPLIARALGIVKSRRYIRNSRWNAISDVRILSRRKPFYVESSLLLAPRGSFTIYRNVHAFKHGTECLFRAKYVGELFTPSKAKVKQTIGAEERIVWVLFPTKGYYEHDVPYKVEKAEVVTATAEIRWRGRIDSQVKNYTFGLFDKSLKRAEEYPVAGVDNTILDIAYDFKVGNFIYPEPLPEGVSITDMRIEFKLGFCYFDGDYFKDPGTNNVVKFSWRLWNRTGRTLTIRHFGLPITCLYEDRRRVSQANSDVFIADRTVAHGHSTFFEGETAIPAWCYGHTAVCHVVNVYKDGMLIYGGGPFFCINVYRLLLP